MRILLFLILVTQNSFAMKKEIKIAVYNNPPHVFADPRGATPATGAAIEFINIYFGSRKEFNVKTVVMPFPRCLAEVGSKKVDVGFLFAKTPDREKNLRYSSTSLATTQSRVLVLKDSKLKEIKSFDDLKGLTLGHSAETFIPPELLKLGVKFDSLSGVDHMARNVERLRLKKIDGLFIATGTAAAYVMDLENKKNEFRSLKVPNELELFVVFRKDLDSETFNVLNGIIEKNRANYQAILSKYLKDAP